MKMHSLLWECVQESGVGGRANLPFSKDLLSHSLRDSILSEWAVCSVYLDWGVEARVPPCHLRDRWVHGPCTCLPGCSRLALHAIHSVLDPWPLYSPNVHSHPGHRHGLRLWQRNASMVPLWQPNHHCDNGRGHCVGVGYGRLRTHSGGGGWMMCEPVVPASACSDHLPRTLYLAQQSNQIDQN